MNGASENFLACTGLSQQEDGGIGECNRFDLSQYGFQCRTVADDFLIGVCVVGTQHASDLSTILWCSLNFQTRSHAKRTANITLEEND